MKKRILFTFIGLLFSFFVSAQMDFGVSVGASNYLGEIGGGSGDAKPFLMDMKMQQTKMAFGGFFRYQVHERISVKLQMNFVRIGGADKFSSDPQRIARNLSFRTDIYEAMVTGEYSFWIMNNVSKYSRTRIDFEAYAFTGFGALLYYPHAQMDGKWYALRPLATEGVDNKYSKATIAIPLGVGAHYTFDNKYRLGVEVGYRFTFTDYLDDVSSRYASPSDLPYAESVYFADRSAEAYASNKYDNLPDPKHYGGTETTNPRRGNPETNDGYLLFQVNASMKINQGRNFQRSRYKSLINRRVSRRKF